MYFLFNVFLLIYENKTYDLGVASIILMFYYKKNIVYF